MFPLKFGQPFLNLFLRECLATLGALVELVNDLVINEII